MGFFSSNSKGDRCEVMQDGSISCKVYKNEDGQKKATGTDVTISADPQNNCEPVLTGSFDINDDDAKRIDKLAGIAKRQCQRGLG